MPTAPNTWLPESFRRPAWLLWVMGLPQLLLLAINANRLLLVRGDMSPHQLAQAMTMALYEVALVVIGGGTWAALRWRRQALGWLPALAIFLAHVGYLWCFTASLDHLLPTTVTTWLLPPTELLYYQYALMMPALFFCGLRLAAIPLPLRPAIDVGATVGALVLMPVAWFALANGAFRLFRHADIPTVVLMVFLVGSTALVLMAFLRVLLFLYAALHQLRGGRYWLLLAAGLAAPLGGLVLNRTIPFPYDFQDPWLYTFTILNGMLLLVPVRTDTRWGMLAFVAKAIAFPFSLYFFVVFLPFLPLSLLAMIAAGAGCLILAPTLLFIVHTRQLLDAARDLSLRHGRPAILGIAALGLLTLPAAYTGRALLERQALMQAVQAVYAPDLQHGDTTLNSLFAHHALYRLRAAKEGLFVPFLTDYYNWLVFDGMILPDHKLDEIARTLFGAPLAKPERRARGLFGDLFGNPRRQWRTGSARRPPAPPREVRIESVDVRTASDGPVHTADVNLTLRNYGAAGAEFVAPVKLPPGVLVNGYWLDVNGTRVNGRVHEKKAAQWVYHMIRDTVRRDPGQLAYAPDGTLDLRVFPFDSAQTRLTGMTLSFPATLKPVIAIGDRTVDLNPDAPGTAPPLLAIPAGPAATWLATSPASAQSLPIVQRPYYLHFVLDRSIAAETQTSRLLEELQAEAARHPRAAGYRLTLANFEFEHLLDSPRPLAELATLHSLPAGDHLPFRGAFCPGRPMKSVLLDTARAEAEAAPPAIPFFVLVRTADGPFTPPAELAAFTHIVPDLAIYSDRIVGGTNRWRTFSGSETDSAFAPLWPLPVHAFRIGQTWGVCLAEKPGVAVLPAKYAASVSVLDPQRGALPLATPATVPKEHGYATGAALWSDYREALAHPPELNLRLPDLVDRSRHTGVLTPLTSFIVVEQESQWEALRRAERKSLRADQALAFDEFIESPEPTVWLLLPVVWFLGRRRTRKPETLNFHVP